MFEAIQNFDAGALLSIQENLRVPFLDGFMTFMTRLGDSGFIWILLGLLLLIPKKTRRSAADVFLCLALAFILNDLILKPLIARARPFETIDGLTILITAPGSFSFPSGHTNASFAAAFALTRAFGKKGALAYIPAILIAFSRCYVGVHYPTDVFAGMTVGTLAAVIACWLSRRYIKSDLFKKTE
ncbi:MAG: phosphatase PAP2 family protein [Clostridiales bacterium]|nr:phosphatase PAP2 family protein [Clostridiales bacterium]